MPAASAPASPPQRPTTTPTRPRKRPVARRAPRQASPGGAAAAAGADGIRHAAAAAGAAAAGSHRRCDDAPDPEADEATRVIPLGDQAPDWLRATPAARQPSRGRADPRRRLRRRRPRRRGAARRGGRCGRRGRRCGRRRRARHRRRAGRQPGPARRRQGVRAQPRHRTARRPGRPRGARPRSCPPSRSPRTSRSWPWASSSASSCSRWSSASTGVSRIGSNSDSARRRGRPGHPHHHRGPVVGGPVGQRVDGRPRAPAPAEPLAILKVEAYDPEGDGEENNNLTPKVYDGDKGTGWFSENYRSDSFGGPEEGPGRHRRPRPEQEAADRRARHPPSQPTSRSTSAPTTASRAPRRSARRPTPTAR